MCREKQKRIGRLPKELDDIISGKAMPRIDEETRSIVNELMRKEESDNQLKGRCK